MKIDFLLRGAADVLSVPITVKTYNRLRKRDDGTKFIVFESLTERHYILNSQHLTSIHFSRGMKCPPAPEEDVEVRLAGIREPLAFEVEAEDFSRKDDLGQLDIMVVQLCDDQLEAGESVIFTDINGKESSFLPDDVAMVSISFRVLPSYEKEMAVWWEVARQTKSDSGPGSSVRWFLERRRCYV